MVGLIANNDESDYRKEVKELVTWRESNNLTLNISKTKEMVVDFRMRAGPHLPLTIKGEVVEQVSSFPFLGTTIHKSLTWEHNTNVIISKAHQRLHFLRQLKKFRVSKTAMTHFYRSAIERILTFSILVWFGTAIAFDKTRLEKVVTKASKIIGCSFPTLSSIYTIRLVRKANRIVADPYNPSVQSAPLWEEIQEPQRTQ